VSRRDYFTKHLKFTFEKTFADNLLAPEKKLRFLMKTFQDFLHIMDFNGVQTVQGPNEFQCKLFKGL